MKDLKSLAKVSPGPLQNQGECCPAGECAPVWHRRRPAPKFGSVVSLRLHLQQRTCVLYCAFLTALGCAAEGPPSGGPRDLRGPVIMQVTPPNGSTGIDTLTDFELLFDELVDPVSVPGSIEFLPTVPFETRIRGRRVRIRPNEPLKPDQAYVLTLQRGIRDYQSNTLAEARQLVFSTGTSIPVGRIRGQIIGQNEGEFVEVGLYRETAEGFTHYQSLGATETGTFDFNYLLDGTYRLAAVSGSLTDFPAGMGLRPYALATVSTLPVKGDTTQLFMQMSAPLAEPQIQSVEWVTPQFLTLTFDQSFGEIMPPEILLPGENPLQFGLLVDPAGADSITIDLGNGRNPLGDEYAIQPFYLPVETLQDTTAPVLLERQKIELRLLPGIAGAAGRLRFSEPVVLPPDHRVLLTGKDTVSALLRARSAMEFSFSVPQPELLSKLSLLTAGIADLAGNALSDSVIILNLTFRRPEASGQIRGRISGAQGAVVVEALDAGEGRRIAWTVTDSSRYLLENLPPGQYRVTAHEQGGPLPLPYYGGRWEPYQPAALFGDYPGEIEVRPRWEVDGIDIKFYAVTNFITESDTGAVGD